MTRIDIQKVQVGESLQGDLYRPVTESHNGAAVVLVYGGAWRTADPTQQKVYGLALAKAGYTCLAADYRPSTKAHWPAQLNDVKSAVTWLRENASRLSIDQGRIAISGNSSGGHLALMTACSAEPQNPAFVKAICAFYPPTNLSGWDDHSADDSVSALMGPRAGKVDYENASPLHYATGPFPPTLFISGQDDDRVPVAQTTAMSNALQQAGNIVELHLFAGQGHAFDAEREHARLCAAILVRFFDHYL